MTSCSYWHFSGQKNEGTFTIFACFSIPHHKQLIFFFADLWVPNETFRFREKKFERENSYISSISWTTYAQVIAPETSVEYLHTNPIQVKNIVVNTSRKSEMESYILAF